MRWLAGAALVAVLAGLVSAGPLFAAPDVPTALFVDSANAQSSASGNPVVDLDLTPVFSAVVTHPDPGATLQDARIQVATDHAFTSILWTSGWLSIAGTTSGGRTPDLAYVGPVLGTNTRYWWRIEARDTALATSGWSTDPASFFTGAAGALLSTVSSFPWKPGEAEEATAWIPNFPSAGLTASGSTWRHGAVSGDRRGSTGPGAVAWSPSPSADYLPNTVTWLQSPVFDFSGVSAGALELRFELWIKAMHRFDGCKLQVSTNGGSSWSDVSTTSVPYNGNTGNSNLLSSQFGGSDDCWTKPGGQLAGTTARTVILDLSSVAGQADVRYRFGFAANATNHREGPVLDGFRIVPAVTGTDVYQETTATITITGAGFTGATGVTFCDPLITVNSFTVVNSTTITANVTTGALAVAGDTCFTVLHPSGDIDGSLRVVYPTDLLPVTDDSEPSRNAAMGAMGVYLVNGEFTKSTTLHATRGRMMGISWDCVYESSNAYHGPLGYGWMGGYFQRVAYDGGSGNITWYTPGARTEVFSWTGSTYTPPAGVYYTATRDAGTGQITLRHRHGMRCVFGADGRLAYCEDRNGNRTTCTYNPVGQLVQVTDDRGRRHEVWWHPHGRVYKIVDYVWDELAPREIALGYDSAGNRVTDAMPETARYSDALSNRITHGHLYDSAHHLLSCTNPREFTASGPPYLVNTYDAQGRVVEQRYGEVGRNFYIRYPSSTLARVIDRRGCRTDITLDTNGRATAIEQFTKFWSVDPVDHTIVTETAGKVRLTDPDKYVTALTFTADHEVLTATYPRGNSTTFTYQPVTTNPDVRGNIIETRRQDNGLGSDPDIVTTATYEPLHQFVAAHTNARGYTTTFVYDPRGNLLSITSPTVALGQPAPQVIVTSTLYNGVGQPTVMTDGEGNVTTLEYFGSGPSEGFLERQTAAAGDLDLKTEFTYDAVGNLLTRSGPRAFENGPLDPDFTETFEVNELNQVWHSTGRALRIGGSDRAESYVYFDANGNVVQQFREYVEADGTEPTAPTDPSDPTTFAKATTPMTATWVESAHAYNLLNYRMASTVDAVAGVPITKYTRTTEYDASDNVVAQVTAEGFRHETTFDERELVHTRTSAAGLAESGTASVRYDDNGTAIRTEDALGNPTDVQVDGFDRAIRITDAAGNYGTTAYDGNSNVVTVARFDAAGALLAQSNRHFDEVDRGYRVSQLALDHTGALIGDDGLATTNTLLDRNSRAVRVTDDNGVTVTRQYDGANRVTAVIDGLLNEVRNTFNAESAVIETQYREVNGLSAAVEVSHTETLRDLLNRRIGFRDQRYDPVNRDTQIDFVLDGWGRTVRVIDALDVPTLHEFDLLSRLTRTVRQPGPSSSSWIVTGLTHDADSRNTARTIYRDGLAATQPQTTQYTFDGRNRVTAVTRPDGDTWTVQWDAQSNRIGWTEPVGASPADHTVVTDTYDVRNLCTGRDVQRGLGIKGTTREAYAFDGLRRRTLAVNYETRGATEYEIVRQSWAYNTLSLPERHGQRLVEHQGHELLDEVTYTVYDAVGLATQYVYHDGRTLTNLYDGINRIRETQDATAGGALLARYDWAGPSRLIRRTYGNNTQTDIDYEPAGCGCGGASHLVTREFHTNTLTGALLFASERRYDVRGDVTAERFAHLGDLGEVFRYDDAQRLTQQAFSADLSGANLDTYANPGQPLPAVPTRTWGLDTRGNRTAVTDVDHLGGGGQTTAYAPNDDTNVYDQVGGQGFVYDRADRMIEDPSTGMKTAYDYKGQPVCSDDDADFSTPEVWYAHDTDGRRRITEKWFEGSYLASAWIGACFFPAVDQCTSCEAPDDVPDEILIFESTGGASGGSSGDGTTPAGSPGTVVQYTPGVTTSGSDGGGDGTSPAQPDGLPRGGTGPGTGAIAQTTKTASGTVTENRYEGPHDDVQGLADASGQVTGSYTRADAYGTMIYNQVSGDLAAGSVTATMTAPFDPELTCLTLAPGLTLPAGVLAGQLAQGTVPGQSGTLSGTLAGVGADGFGNTLIYLRDPTGAWLGGAGASLRFMAVHDPVALARTLPPSSQGVLPVPPTQYGPDPRLAVIEDPSQDFSTQLGDVITVTVQTPGGPVTEHTDIRGLAGGSPTMALVPWNPDYATGISTEYAVYDTSGDGKATAGHWRQPPTYDALTDTTTYYPEVEGAEWLVGCYLQPDANIQAFYPIVEVEGSQYYYRTNGNTTQSAGSVAYVVVSPTGIDSRTGRDGAVGSFYGGMTHITYAGGWNTPAPAGVAAGTFGTGSLGGPVQGRQPGIDRAGEMHFWHRDLKTSIGRWKTPDPMDEPWWNRQDHVVGRPLTGTDSRGLYTRINARGSTEYRFRKTAAGRVRESHKLSDDYKVGPEGEGALPSGDDCPPCALVWVHGWNNTPADAANNADAIEDAHQEVSACAGRNPCEVFAFEWRSETGLNFWPAKDASEQVATGAFKKFLLDLQKNCPNTKINLGGHSLGANMIAHALADPDVRGIGNVILAAPATANGYFGTEAGHQAAASAANISLIVNHHDKALFGYHGAMADPALGRWGPEGDDDLPGNLRIHDFTSGNYLPGTSRYESSHSYIYEHTPSRTALMLVGPMAGQHRIR